MDLNFPKPKKRSYFCLALSRDDIGRSRQAVSCKPLPMQSSENSNSGSTVLKEWNHHPTLIRDPDIMELKKKYGIGLGQTAHMLNSSTKQAGMSLNSSFTLDSSTINKTSEHIDLWSTMPSAMNTSSCRPRSQLRSRDFGDLEGYYRNEFETKELSENFNINN